MKRGLVAIVGFSTLLVAAEGVTADGKTVYMQVCAACHTTGIAGAPKLGDKAAWALRLSAGKDALLAAVLKGKGTMPLKGGNASVSDSDARSAVDYMLSQAK